ASVAGGQLSPTKILDSFNEAAFNWAGQKFPAMVLPGMAAKFSGELEDLFAGKAKIMVGPEDSGRIIGWMKEFWPPK
ncbi:MAG: acetyl-CoA synthase subunit gamma, partial [Methanothrix sp.]|nr:acetyl-CoA synthase subunit gamma [Methanothrix sp.]MDD2835447.1 acetyl-CoA synthase subunit gamma [Methanothrix sp.]